MKIVSYKSELQNLCEILLENFVECEVNHMVAEKKDIAKLFPTVWLNDTIINFYLEMLKNHAKKRGTNFYAFTTFFYTKLLRDHERTLNEFPEINFDAFDFLLIPIHETNHWTLFIFDIKQKTFEFLDSLGGKLDMQKFRLLKYFFVNYKEKFKLNYGIKLQNSLKCSQQSNSYDCGVFVLYFAKCKTEQKSFHLNEKDSVCLRNKLIYEIITKNIIYSCEHKCL